MQVRRIMMHAHRKGIDYPEIHRILADPSRFRLAAQIAHGRNGGTTSKPQVARFLSEQWASTAKEVAKRPAWSRDDALDFIEHVSEALDASEVPSKDRAVIEAVLTLARQHGTSRVAAPVLQVAAMAGLSKSDAHRVLMRICEAGDWLSLAQHGNHRTHRANLYNLSPPLAATYGGLSAPMSQAPPMSHPPTSQPSPEEHVQITITISSEELADWRAFLDRSEAAIDDLDGPTGNVTHLRGSVA